MSSALSLLKLDEMDEKEKRWFELERKNDYIKLYSANILVMGDDWQDKFDWVDCCVIYLPRTPNISSTMLREQMNVKFAS